MSTDTVISPRVYRAIQNVDFDEIAKLSVTQKPLRPVLPFLVRMSLLAPVPDALTKQNNDIRKQILVILNNLDHVNSLVRHLTIEFHLLEQDVKKEQQLRQKLGSSKKDSILIQNVGDLTTEFERCDSTRRIRLILSELLFIQSQIAEQQSKSSTDFLIKQSDLFDNVVYLEELSDIISIAIAELPSLLNVTDVVETLLHVNNSARVICAIVANKPCCFMEVVTSLIANAERQEEDSVGSRTRMSVLVALCEMNPGQALAVRARCVELCRMPALTARLSQTREGQEGDMVSFLSGLLLGYDQTTRNWFAQFIRTSQKRKGEGATAVQLLRDELLRRLKDILSLSTDSQLPKSCVRQATSLLRLYCSLRGIAGIKFGDEELNLLLKLVTSRPPASPVGVRFVSLGLCMLIACPSLLSHPSHEAKGIEWVQWLVQEEAYFESASGVTASFGEMLLLMAIHFHSNQLSAICELVCATLGMKVPLRPNNMTRLKQIFTQEIFTEQVVASHAVKVPVTVNLNANIPGYLPVHCIHQLLKSRVFAKHKVSIKGWIYKQICNVSEPVHPVLPHLIEAYITSMLVPNLKAQSEHTHKPISEEEIRKVFQNSVFGAHFNKKRKVCSVFEFGEETQDVDDVVIGKPTLASQLLLLYYLLLYEDVRLSNTINNITNGREVKSYSTEFLSELPIKFLLLQAEKGQSLYACLFAPLLKLATTHFPHLSLVDDWFQDVFSNSSSYKSDKLTEDFIKEAFNTIETNPKKTIKMLKKLLHQRPIDIWVYANTFIRYIKDVLGDKTQRKVQELYKDIWMQLNTVLPRSLWVMTINSLQNENAATKDVSLTQENILVDPLQVLRCDKRVFRCAPILQIVLRMLHASLAASKIQLTRHMMDKPLIEKSGQLSTETEREELRIALVASQESLSVQILLDACVENDDDRNNPGQKTALCEIRSLICSHLHQVFIADPSLVKLIHFQGYSRELIGMTMRGIPSMHICLDFIPELLSQSCIEKQIFAVDLISELSLQYPLPKSMSVARLCVNALSTLLGALSSDTSVILFRSTLPCLVRICQVFPPLLEDIISLLMQLGRVAESQASLGRISAGPQTVLSPMSRIQAQQSRETQSDELCEEIQETMNDIFKKALLQSNIMSKTETTEHKDGILKRLPKEKKVLTFVRNLSDVNEEIKCDEVETEFDSEYSESESDEMSLDHDSLDVKYRLTDLFDDGAYCNVSNTDIVPEGLQEKKENNCQNKSQPMDTD